MIPVAVAVLLSLRRLCRAAHQAFVVVFRRFSFRSNQKESASHFNMRISVVKMNNSVVRSSFSCQFVHSDFVFFQKDLAVLIMSRSDDYMGKGGPQTLLFLNGLG